MTLLTLSGMDDVVEILRELEPSSEETGEKIRKLIGYLEKNRDRIDYEGDKFEGFPIGSGAIESANKFICHKRMKVSGAWWVKDSGNSMLRIRCAVVNGTYARVFNHNVVRSGKNRLRAVDK